MTETKRRTTPQNAAVFRYLAGSAGRVYGDEVADALEISRSTVYAALKRLEADGLALAEQGKGYLGARMARLLAQAVAENGLPLLLMVWPL
jgi:biotin operon repressor